MRMATRINPKQMEWWSNSSIGWRCNKSSRSSVNFFGLTLGKNPLRCRNDLFLQHPLAPQFSVMSNAVVVFRGIDHDKIESLTQSRRIR